MTRGQLTYAVGEFTGPYLPIGEYGPYPERLRRQFEGVVCRFRTGRQWREMPQEFGAWSTVHHRLRQWRDPGAFEALLEGAATGAVKRDEVDLSLVSGDSATVRAHHEAAGMHLDPDTPAEPEKAAEEAEKAGEGGGPGRRGRAGCGGDPEREERQRARRRRKIRLKAVLLERSRGGQAGKVQIAGERKFRPLAFVLTEGQATTARSSSPWWGKSGSVDPSAVPVPGPAGSPGTRPARPAATAPTCVNAGSRSSSRRRSTRPPAGRGSGADGRPVGHDAEPYEGRNAAERLINKPKVWRGMVTRYDKTPESYLAGLHLRTPMIWVKDLTEPIPRSQPDTHL